MRKMLRLLSIATVLLFAGLVFAGHDFTETKKIVDSGIGCGNLTGEQLEPIGDYYMELMHPGAAHETMDRMMGGEGSENLKQAHILMARRFYCNETAGGMMGAPWGQAQGDMMRGMMGAQWGQNPMQGMMGGYGTYGLGWNGPGYPVLAVSLAVLVYLGVTKLGRGHPQRRGNKMKKSENIPASTAALLVLLLLFVFGLGFGGMGGMMLFGPLFMLLLLVLVVWLIVSLTQPARQQ